MDQLPGESIARAFYEALAGSDVRTVAGSLDDASLLHVAGGSGLAGDYQGRETILGWLRHRAELTGGTLRYTASGPARVTGGDLVVCGSARGTRGGRSLATEATLRVTVDSGVLREIWLSHSDRSACDEFWS